MRPHSVSCALTAIALSLALAPAALALGPPINTSPPVISGSPQPGQTLTCSPGTWSNAPSGTTYAFAWQRDATSTISTTNQYVVATGDVGHLLTCTVIATSGGFSSLPALSTPPTLVLALPLAPTETALPVITGTPDAGSAVFCSSGSWTNSPTSYAYTWQRNATAIAGATSSTYTLSASDVGNAVTCAVVASNAVGSSVPAISLPIMPSAAPTGTGGGSGSGGSGSGSGSGSASLGGSGSGSGAGGAGSSGAKTLQHKPSLTAFSVSPHRLLVKVRGHRSTSSGLTFRYRLDRVASVLLVIERRGSHGRWVTVTELAVRNARGAFDRLHFSGRVGGKLLAAGSYRAVIAAANSTGWSAPRSARFSVLRRSRSAPRRHGHPSHPQHR